MQAWSNPRFDLFAYDTWSCSPTEFTEDIIMDKIDGASGNNGYGNTVVNNRNTTNTNAAQTNSVTADTTPSDESSVSLSSGAANMKSLTQTLSAEPSFDQAKVDRIKTLISQGQYSIDPAKIAAKFASMEGQHG